MMVMEKQMKMEMWITYTVSHQLTSSVSKYVLSADRWQRKFSNSSLGLISLTLGGMDSQNIQMSLHLTQPLVAQHYQLGMRSCWDLRMLFPVLSQMKTSFQAMRSCSQLMMRYHSFAIDTPSEH